MTAPRTHILLVEDDLNLGTIVAESLEFRGLDVTRCQDGAEGYTTFLRGTFDLCLIDVMLPKKDGFTLAEEIRVLDREVPIIFLTAKSMPESRIRGFQVGGDDYLTKPFNMEELVLRIEAILKRTRLKDRDGEAACFTLGAYTFDYRRRELDHAGRVRSLTGTEAELLRLLCLHENRILERSVVLNLIWGEDNIFKARSMDVFISRLRKYLREDPGVEIVTLHGRGYRLQLTGE
ncbi:response regulator transcription factor [Gemmatimonadota bacterium]